MAESVIRVLSFPGPLLSAEAVAAIEGALREQPDAAPVVLDCQHLTEVSASGLSALLELGRSASGMRELGLTQLSRALTLMAIQAGLAERFSIFATNEACMRSFAAAGSASCAP